MRAAGAALGSGGAACGTSVCSVRKRGQGAQNRRTWSAGWRARRSQGAPPPEGGKLTVRHSALHPLIVFREGKRDDGEPGAANNTGDGARLFFIPVRSRESGDPVVSQR